MTAADWLTTRTWPEKPINHHRSTLVLVCKLIFHSRRLPGRSHHRRLLKRQKTIDRSWIDLETNIIYLLQSFIKYLTLTCKKRTPSVHWYLLIKTRLIRNQAQFCRRAGSKSCAVIRKHNMRQGRMVIIKRNRLKLLQRRQQQIERYFHGWRNREVSRNKQVSWF